MTAISPLHIEPFVKPDIEVYDLQCRAIQLGKAPVGCIICEVGPGQASRVHKHFESEVFLFLSGKGEFISDGEATPVEAGTTIESPAFANHFVRNDSPTEPMQFMSVYWSGEAATEKAARPTQDTLIFSTPPTPNGDLHLGHLSGPYLAADIYRRALGRNGERAMHVTGRDDHQTYVLRKSLSSGSTPLAVAEQYAAEIRRTLRASNVPLDYFIEPSSTGAYAAFVCSVFEKLYAKGLIYAKDAPALFDEATGRYLHEAFVSGRCPHCGAGSDGNACEQCGRPNQCVDLHDASSLFSRQQPRTRTCRRLFFRLGALAEELARYAKTTPMSAHALALSEAMIADGLPDICVSHPTELGIAVPIDGFTGQKIYVWFEMAAGYLWSAAQMLDPDAEPTLAKAAEAYDKMRVVHFYGFDNTWYHTLLFPAVYLALGIRPPAAHVLNELLDLDNRKFSTSRGHLIWAHDLLRRVSADYMRWALSGIRPEGVRSNFSIEGFCAEVNGHFHETLLPWTRGLAELLSGNLGGKMPETGAWTPEHEAFHAEIQAFAAGGADLLETESYSPRNATVALRIFSEKSLRFLQAQAILQRVPATRDFLRTAAALSALALRAYAVRAAPITPDFARAILGFLGISDGHAANDITFVPPGSVLVPDRLPAWPRIDPGTLEDLRPATATPSTQPKLQGAL